MNWITYAYCGYYRSLKLETTVRKIKSYLNKLENEIDLILGEAIDHDRKSAEATLEEIWSAIPTKIRDLFFRLEICKAKRST